MPPGGSAAVSVDYIPNNVPTGVNLMAEIALPVPQDIITSGVNTNSVGSVVWRIWNDIYTGTTVITQGTSSTTGTGTLSALTATDVHMTTTTNAVWGAWNALQQQAVVQAIQTHLYEPITATTGASITSAVWGNWNNVLQNMHNATAEQVAQAQRQVAEARDRQTRAAAAVQVEKTLAERRAEKLLQETLSAKQREELASKGFFTLETIAKSGERRIYRIKRGRTANVEQVDEQGNRIKRLCAHPTAIVPDADTMVAQKLMLESQEEEFLRIANHS